MTVVEMKQTSDQTYNICSLSGKDMNVVELKQTLDQTYNSCVLSAKDVIGVELKQTSDIGVGAIFGRGAKTFWGPTGAPSRPTLAPNSGASNNHNLAFLHCTLFDGAHFAYFLVLVTSNRLHRDFWVLQGNNILVLF